MRSWIVEGNSKLNPSISIIFCLSAFLEVGQDYLFVLIFMQGADHLTLEGGRGWVILKKKNSASACREKNIACSKNVIESLWKKREKNILPTILVEKKVLDEQKSTTPPPQELNGRSLSEERKIAPKVKFARIAHDWQLNIKVSGS